MDTRVVAITGSAVGIGRGVAESHAGEGATVIAIDIDQNENAVTKSMVEAAGGTCLAFTCDIGDRQAVKALFAKLESEVDKIDLLVNNAAVFNDTTLTGGSYESQTMAFDQAMGACAMGAYYCTAAALPLLEKADEANIVNILTDHVKPGHELTGGPATGYDCAKFSLWRLTENWAAELKEKGIRVNGLCFGATDTPMLEKWAPQMLGKGMVVGDVDAAIRNVVNQGPDGATGASYEFGMGPTPRETSLNQIAAIRN